MRKTILLGLLLMLKQLSFSQCLNGIYTIGGASPSFTSITQAVNTLTVNGVCGPVTFNIRPGTYNERITMPVVAGSSSVNTIVFQSETADSSSTILQVVGNSTQNYVVKLDGTDFVTVKNLTLKNTDASYMCLVYLVNGVLNFNLSNCVIDAPITSSILANANRYLINSTTNTNVNCVIQNNKITGGQRGIYVNSNNATTNDFRIINNNFSNQYEYSITLVGVKAPVISSNTITNTLAYNSYYGIYLYSISQNATITKNKIKQTGGYGIMMLTNSSSSSYYSLVANNLIEVSGISAGSYGVYIQNCSFINLYHNTIISTNTNTSSGCAYFGSSNYVNSKNNIIYHKNGGLIYTALPTNFVSDYNDLFTTGTALINNGSLYAFNNWKALGYDNNSLNYIPQFISPTNFHIASDFSQNLLLPFFASVPDDIDGNLRDNISPYFGAYEFVNPQNINDAAVDRFVLNASICPGNQALNIVLKNFGANPLTSVILNWSINGTTQTPVNWTGNLGFYDSASVVVGNYNFANLATYTIVAWTSLPNNVIDDLPINDTVKRSPIYTALSGTYTIGSGGNFNNFDIFETQIKNRGVCGNLVLNVLSGIYTSSITLNNIKGLTEPGNTNSLTIQSLSGVNSAVTIYEGVYSKNIFSFQNIENVSIKNLTISHSGNMDAIQFTDRAKNIVVSGCSISTGNGTCVNFVTNTLAVSNIAINNNTHTGGANFLTFLNTLGNHLTKNIKILNNGLNGVSGSNINMQGMDSVEIRNNVAASSTNTLVNTMIYLDNCLGGKITGNKVFTTNYKAIHVINSDGILIANNMAIGTGAATAVEVIKIENCKNTHFVNNSILCANTNTASVGLNYIYSSGTPTNNRVWNNIIQSNSSGLAIKFQQYTGQTNCLKANVYFYSGTNLGQYNGSTIANIAAWKTATSSDSSSFVINPQFYSPTNLHVNEYALNNKAIPVLSDITDDFDGQARNVATPDIGADEFTLMGVDAATNGFNFSTILCTGTNPIQVILKNNGTTTLSSATLGCKVNSTVLSNYNWSGSLAAGTQTIVTIGSYNFLANTNYSIKAWSSLPNGTADTFKNNDTTLRVYNNVGMYGVFTIGGSSPSFTSIGSAITALKNGGICGPITFNIRNGIYNEQIKIPNIKGVSSINTILFQSESLDSSLVSIEFGGTSALNYVVTVDSTDYITFNKLGFKALNAVYANIFTGTNKANNIQIKNCSFIGQPSAGILIALASSCDSVLIANNRLYKSTIGISVNSLYNKVLQNSFEDQSQYGISGNGLNFDYSSNKFVFTTFNGQAIYINGIAGGNVFKNRISYVAGSNDAIRLTNTGTLANPLFIANNFISVNGGSGIKLINVQYGYLFYNSINQVGNSSCLSYTNVANSISQNNIFYSGGGFCVSTNVNNPSFSSTYNCIYNPTGKLISVGSATYSTLSAYTATTSMEANSVSADPLFNSYSDLHVSNCAAISDSALYNSNVTDDIDGNVRSASTPDIGADEFILSNLNNDAQVLQIYVSNSGCGGSQTLYAKIKNIGTTNLTTVQLSAKVASSTVSPVTWNGNLAQGQTKDSVSLGLVSSLYGNISIKAWTLLPNGTVDGNMTNDTAVYQLPNTALKGIYKVGGTNPDFVSLRAVKNALMTYGLCGAVAFDFRPGTYQDTLSLPSIVSSSSVNTITFQSENGDSSSVIISDFAIPATVSQHYTLRLRGLQNVTFSKLTFKQNVTSVVYQAHVIFGDYISGSNISNVKFLNCSVLSNTITNNGINIISVNNLQNFELKNCLVTSGSVGLGIGSITSTLSTINIKDNIFSDQINHGISIGSINGTTIIDNNMIKKAGLINGCGIISYNASKLNITRNKITLASGTGIYITGGLLSLNNNFIYIKSGTSLNGLQLESSLAGSNIAFNTVRIKSGNSTNIFVNGSNCSVKNNIFENKGTGLIYNVSGVGAVTVLNNRCSNVSSIFGSKNGTAYTTLNTWQAGTGYDTNSQNSPTYFINDSTYKVQGDYSLNNSAVSISGITTDIESNLRNVSTPDIGAYEFNIENDDAGIIRYVNPTDSVLCNGSNSINLVLRNFGANNLNSVEFNWKLNGVTQPLYNWSGNLVSGDSATVNIGSVNILGGQKNTFIFYTANPNGVADVSKFNDTLKTNSFKTRLSGIYTVGGTSPNYTTLKQATDSLQRFGICGPVTFNIRNGIHKGSFQLVDFQGTSATNRITFQSESLDSSLVIISDSAAFISINANYVTFNKLTFKQKGILNYGSLGFNMATGGIVSNCVFSNQVMGGGLGVYFQRNYRPMTTTIKNNLFKKGTGSGYSSSSLGTFTNVAIYSNNTFELNANFGTDLVDSLVLEGNIFNRIIFSIENSNKTVAINNNKFIRCLDISIENCSTSTFSKDFYNNIIDSVDNFTFKNVPKINIYNNTFSTYNKYGTQAKITFDGTMAAQQIRNNIFHNTGGGACISIYNAPSFSGNNVPNLFDNNAIYTQRDTLVIIYSPIRYVVKSAWKSTYLQDQNSVFYKPTFAGLHDFHIVNDHFMDNLGTSTLSSSSDLDGVLRNVSTPDIGAYEFNSIPLIDDAGIFSIQNSNSNCDHSVNPFTVVLKNYGSNNLTTVTVKWKVNGLTQPDYAWTGNLSSGDTSIVTIGTFTVVPGVNSNMIVNTYLPNGNVDGYSGNDTLISNNNLNKLNGIYSVGGVGADFAGLTEVLNNLTNKGICGPVVFKLSPGTYTIGFTSYDVTNISGNSLQNTITFESANGNNTSVVINGIKLGVSYVNGVIFRNLTFNSCETVLGLNANNVTFIGNVFSGSPASNGNFFSSIYSTTYHEGLKIINNNFTQGSANYLYYNHVYGGAYPKRILIKGNVFNLPGRNGIEIWNSDSLLVDSNYFYRTDVNNVYNTQAMRIIQPRNYFKITRNYINGTFETGINLGIKNGNHITGSSIENNVVIGSTLTHGGIGSLCDSVSYFYNTVFMPTTFFNYACISPASKSIVKNNIFVSNGAKLMNIGNPVDVISDYNVLYSPATNLLTYYTYTTASTTTVTSFSTYTTNTGLDAHSTFADPQFVNNTLDLHYLNHLLDGTAIPLPNVLIDQQNITRHLTTPNPGAYEAPPDTTFDTINKYLSLKSIQTSTLIVGANNPITASVFYTFPLNTDTNVYKYRGTIDSLRMHYQVNNQPEVIEKWHGTLHLQDSMTYTFTSPFYVPNGKLYSIKVWFENLNPNNYEVNVTDDSLKRVIILPMQGDYTVGGSYPDFTTLDQVTTSVYNCGAIGNIRYLMRPGYYGLNFPGPTIFLQEYRPESGNVNEVFTEMSFGYSNCKLTKLHITTSTASQSGIYGPYPGIQCFGYIDVDSCTIRGNAATPFYGGFQFFQAPNTGHSARITNSRFVKLNFAVSLVSNTSGSTFTTHNTTDFVFDNNIIDSCAYGVCIAKLDSNNWVRINHNSINTYSTGIILQGNNMLGKLHVSYNKITSKFAWDDYISSGSLTDLIVENNMCKSYYYSEIGSIKVKVFNNSFDGTTYINCSDTSTIYNNIFQERSAILNYPGYSKQLLGLFLSCNISKTKFEHNNIHAPNLAMKAQINSNWIYAIPQIFAQSSIGYRTYDFNPLFVSSTDLHSLSANMKNMGLAIPTLTNDIDGDVRPAGPIDIGADEIQIPFTGVWPGDANNDLQVTSQDLYSIGLHYGNHNYRRDSISDYYVAHLCTDWSVNQTGSSVDMKYADCNGDSLIDMNDTMAINLNYNLTHLPKASAVTTNTLTDITLQFNKVLYFPGDTVKADVIIGSATNIQNNLYGSSFRISYEVNKVKANTEKMIFINSWVGNINSTKIKFSNINTTQGLLDASLVRITHTDVTGYGKVGTFIFVLQDTLTSSTVHVSIIDADKIDYAAALTPLMPGADSITVVPNGIITSIDERILNTISIYPNPAADYVKINFGANHEVKCQMELNAMDGKSILSKTITSTTNAISLSNVAKGVYALKLIMGDGHSKVFKLVVQ
jgi:hypothetical protein